MYNHVLASTLSLVALAHLCLWPMVYWYCGLRSLLWTKILIVDPLIVVANWITIWLKVVVSLMGLCCLVSMQLHLTFVLWWHNVFSVNLPPSWFAGRRDYRDHEFRLRPDRRHSPRYSPERDIRRRSFRDKRPSSEDRGKHFILCTLVPIKFTCHCPFYPLTTPWNLICRIKSFKITY